MWHKNKIISVGDIDIKINSYFWIGSRAHLLEVYWSFHPRFCFYKKTPIDARFLDVGAGSGNLSFWKGWGKPVRNDIKMYGVDVRDAEHKNNYVNFQVADVEKTGLGFNDGFFDIIFLSHVLEHFNNPEYVLKEIRRVTKPGGRIYIEFPSPVTVYYPTREDFLKKGFEVSITNFFDDVSHKRTYTMEFLDVMLHGAGLKIVESGIIRNKRLEDKLIGYGFKNRDEEITTYGVWSKLMWAQYVICETM